MSVAADPEPGSARAAPSVDPVTPPAAPPVDPLVPPGADPSPTSSLASPSSVLVASDAASIFESEPATDRPGHQVVLGLFVVLGLCVVTVFTIFALAVRPEDREWVPELTARYLYMPVVATGILVAIDAWRAGRKRWWVFLVMAPVPVVNVVLAAMWLLKWRHASP